MSWTSSLYGVVGCREISGQEADAHRPAAEPGSDVRERLEQIGTDRAVAPQAPAPDVADVPAYVLSVNGFPEGKLVLPFVNDSLKAIAFVTTKP